MEYKLTSKQRDYIKDLLDKHVALIGKILTVELPFVDLKQEPKNHEETNNLIQVLIKVNVFLESIAKEIFGRSTLMNVNLIFKKEMPIVMNYVDLPYKTNQIVEFTNKKL